MAFRLGGAWVRGSWQQRDGAQLKGRCLPAALPGTWVRKQFRSKKELGKFWALCGTQAFGAFRENRLRNLFPDKRGL